MARRFHMRDGKLLVRAAKLVAGDCDCPCGPCGGCPTLFALTFAGVGGCGGRCDSHNLTAVVPNTAECVWITPSFPSSSFFPQPATEPPGGDCEAINSSGGVLGGGSLSIAAPNIVTVIVEDILFSGGPFAGYSVRVTWTGTFDGPCADMDVTFGSPTVEVTSPSGNTQCPDCDEVSAGVYAWCNWFTATVRVQAL